MEEAAGSIVNYLLATLGFLSTLAVIFGPLGAIIFLILYLIEDNKKSKKRYGKWAIISAIAFVVGLITIFVVLGSFAVVSTMMQAN